MKMKTQIKRKAKRMLSLLLTAMLLISTMVGGISTVSAAEDTLQPTTTPVADGYYRVFVTDSKYFNSAPYIHYWGGSSATDWNKRPAMNKLTGTNAQNQSVYWYDVPSDSTGIIFQHPNEKQSVDLMVRSDDTLKFQNGAGYYISDYKDEKYLYSYWDASSLLPSNAVASSVALSASNTQINPNDTVTLTATLTGKKSNTVTLTLVDGNGTTVETKSVTADSATFTVTPSAETTYKVVASAEGYNSVESAAVTVHIVGSKTFYLWRSNENNIGNTSVWDSPVQMQMNADGKYVCDVDVKRGNNFVTITEDKVNPYKSLTAWNSGNEVNVNVTEKSSIISNIYPQQYQVDKMYYFPLFVSTQEGRITFAFDGAKALVASDAGSTPVENVTINVPTVDNATVTAASDTATAAEGKSLTIAKDSTFTVTVKPDEGYELASIAYNGKTKTESPATFTASVSGGITVAVNKKENPT